MTTSTVCTLKVQFLLLNPQARKIALSLASPPDKRHHEPFIKGGSIETHNHSEHFVYVLDGTGAAFTVIGNDEKIIDIKVLGNNQKFNAVVIPKGVMHRWDQGTEGDQIHDISGLERIVQIFQAQLEHAAA